MRTLLYAPAEYWDLTPEQRAGMTNGCGPGKFGGFLVPDTIWWLNVSEACNIHDFQYAIGFGIDDKCEADRSFLNNMLRLIDSAGGWWILKAMRRRAALKYYQAVADFGGPAFWRGKNPAKTMQLVKTN